MTTYKELFLYLENECNFQGKGDDLTWKCFGDLRFTKKFCKVNNLNFNEVKTKLNDTGGFCDCEVLFNSAEKIKHKVELQ